jgi:hypothetical protein
MDGAHQFAAVDDTFMLRQFGRKCGKPLVEDTPRIACVKLPSRSLSNCSTNTIVKTGGFRRFAPDCFAWGIRFFRVARGLGYCGSKGRRRAAGRASIRQFGFDFLPPRRKIADGLVIDAGKLERAVLAEATAKPRSPISLARAA